MSHAFRIVLALVFASPAVAAVAASAMLGPFLVIVAVALTLAGLGLGRGDSTQATKVAGPAALLAAIPAAWMLVHLLPISGLAHPIWASAAATLGETWTGPASVDIGRTMEGLLWYGATIGLLLATIVVALDRERAEWLLLALTGTTTAMALTVIGHDLSGATFLGELSGATRATFDAAAALGVVLAAAVIELVIERHETRHRRPGTSVVRLVERLSAAFAALLICGFAVIYFQSNGLAVAAAGGLAVFATVVTIRRLALGRWGGLGMGAAVAAAFVMVIVATAPADGSDPTTWFAASRARSPSTERSLADAGPLGWGAGTWTTFEAVHRGVDEAVEAPPTTAAALAVELGWLGLVGVIAVAAGAGGLLLQGAFRRGRDSFYAAAAAGGLVVIVLEAFRDASLLQPTLAILAPVIVGLGFAQRASRSRRS